MNGNGVPLDKEKAILWFKKAASGGHIIATSILGRMAFENASDEDDIVQAREYYEQAARQGHVPSQRILGLLYIDGVGGPQSISEGVFWLYIAADRFDKLALTELEKLQNSDSLKEIDLKAMRAKATIWASQSVVPQAYEDLLRDYNQAKMTIEKTISTSSNLNEDNQIEAEGQRRFYIHEIALIESEIHLHFGRESPRRKAWRLAYQRWIQSMHTVTTKDQLLKVFSRIGAEIAQFRAVDDIALVDASRFMGRTGPSTGVDVAAASPPLSQFLDIWNAYLKRFGVDKIPDSQADEHTNTNREQRGQTMRAVLIQEVAARQLGKHLEWLKSQINDSQR